MLYVAFIVCFGWLVCVKLLVGYYLLDWVC